MMAKGVARVKITSPKKFAEQFGSGKNASSSQALSTVTKFCSDILKNIMSEHEMQELSGNALLLEPPLKEALSHAGMDPVRITFSYVGEFGPGMFAPSQGGNPQSAEQARHMAESMRAAQMAKLQAIQEMMQQRQSNIPGAVPPVPSTVNCLDCHTPNPQGSKFCNNCGKLLPATKKACPSCGKLLEPNVRFCGNCGTKL
jgi:Double zinc ribbon